MAGSCRRRMSARVPRGFGPTVSAGETGGRSRYRRRTARPDPRAEFPRRTRTARAPLRPGARLSGLTPLASPIPQTSDASHAPADFGVYEALDSAGGVRKRAPLRDWVSPAHRIPQTPEAPGASAELGTPVPRSTVSRIAARVAGARVRLVDHRDPDGRNTELGVSQGRVYELRFDRVR